MELVLASASPRRKELLSQIGVQFTVRPVDICEDVLPGEEAAIYVERLARAKAQVCFEQLGADQIALGSDTTVVQGSAILGKPANKEEAVRTLQQLSGQTHEVLTAIALVGAEQSVSRVVKTEVCFRPLSVAECERYWETGEPADKAGAYGIQGLGAVFVEAIKGSYSSVVGLPLKETAELLEAAGVKIWETDK